MWWILRRSVTPKIAIVESLQILCGQEEILESCCSLLAMRSLHILVVISSFLAAATVIPIEEVRIAPSVNKRTLRKVNTTQSLQSLIEDDNLGGPIKPLNEKIDVVLVPNRRKIKCSTSNTTLQKSKDPLEQAINALTEPG